MSRLIWDVAIITAPRTAPTLRKCQDSLDAAGWPNALEVVDSQCSGCYVNWQRALMRLLERSPDADFLMVAEDDAIFARGTRDYLDLYPPDRDAINSLYCAAPNHRPDLFGWHAVHIPKMAYGALAYAMTPHLARWILNTLAHPDWANGTDIAMGKWCKERRVGYLCHSPSLVWHAGEISSLSNPSQDHGTRQAKHWLRSIELAH